MAFTIKRSGLLATILFWLKRAHNLFWEIYLNVNTLTHLTRAYTNGLYGDANGYAGSAYYVLLMIFKRLSITKDSQFVDYGCGKGRAVCFAARLPFRKVVGVEVNHELACIARINANKMRKRKASIEIIENDVLNYDCKDGTIFFMYNSFGTKTLGAVLEKIHQSLRQNPRTIQIIYYNPVHSELFRKCEWLEKNNALSFKTLAMDEARVPCVEFYQNK